MSNEYSISDPPRPTRVEAESSRSDPKSSVFINLLWVLIAAGVITNAMMSFSGVHMAISALVGTATVACVVLLIVLHVRGSKKR